MLFIDESIALTLLQHALHVVLSIVCLHQRRILEVILFSLGLRLIFLLITFLNILTCVAIINTDFVITLGHLLVIHRAFNNIFVGTIVNNLNIR